MSDEPGHAARRARSFGAIAQAYHAHRPTYPDSALDWALAPLAVDSPALLDLGAGTGKLTSSLVGRSAAEVTAVEPDPAMLDVLRRELPEVTALSGTAEEIPLPDGSVDAVLVGQAFHWFDGPAATAEIVRVLRPGGVVALLWNREDGDLDWVRSYYEAVRWREHVPEHETPAPAGHPALGPTSTQEFANPVPTTVDGLLDTLATYSWISTMEPAEQCATMDRARAYLGTRAETGAPGAVFELPMRTTVLRAERR